MMIIHICVVTTAIVVVVVVAALGVRVVEVGATCGSPGHCGI